MSRIIILGIILVFFLSCSLRINPTPQPYILPATTSVAATPVTGSDFSIVVSSALSVEGSAGDDVYSPPPVLVDATTRVGDVRGGASQNYEKRTHGENYVNPSSDAHASFTYNYDIPSKELKISATVSGHTRGGYWTDTVWGFLEGHGHDATSVSKSRATININVNLSAPKLFVLKVNNNSGGQLSMAVDEVISGKRTIIPPSSDGNFLLNLGKGDYLLKTEYSAVSQSTGACNYCQETYSNVLELILYSYTDRIPGGSLYGAASIPYPFTVSLPNKLLMQTLETTTFPNGKFYPCKDMKSDCYKEARDLYLEYPEILGQPPRSIVSFHLSGQIHHGIFSPSLVGNISVFGLPVLDKGILKFPDLDWEAKSSSELLKVLNDVAHNDIKNKLKEALVFNVQNNIDEKIAELKSAMPIKRDGICVNIDATSLKLIDIAAMADHFDLKFVLNMVIEDSNKCEGAKYSLITGPDGAKSALCPNPY
jgi:hypothetical protein